MSEARPAVLDAKNLIDRLLDNCVGKPAKINWPHRLLHDAAEAIGSLVQQMDSAVAGRDEALEHAKEGWEHAHHWKAERDAAIQRAEAAEIDAELFKGEVKLRNRITVTNTDAAALQRRLDAAFNEGIDAAAKAATEWLDPDSADGFEVIEAIRALRRPTNE